MVEENACPNIEKHPSLSAFTSFLPLTLTLTLTLTLPDANDVSIFLPFNEFNRSYAYLSLLGFTILDHIHLRKIFCSIPSADLSQHQLLLFNSFFSTCSLLIFIDYHSHFNEYNLSID